MKTNLFLHLLKVTDEIGETANWETSIKNQGFEKSSEQPVSLDSITNDILRENLNLSEQCNHEVKKDEYFIMKGKSPRNKTISLAILIYNFQEMLKEKNSLP